MTLNELWFGLIGVLWVGYFVLEGFDFGTGALLRLIGRDERGRRVLINAIGPVWDGNEVWLLVAGGATFAAFPHWYATLFSGFYIPLLAILVFLIIRAVAFEYRGKMDSPVWRRRWDLAIVICSAGPALLWGVAFGNFLRGVPIDADFDYAGTVLDLLTPFPLLVGVTTLLLFTTHGAFFLALKTADEVRERAQRWVGRLGPVTVAALLIVALWGGAVRGNAASVTMGIVGALVFAAAVVAARAGRDKWAFTASAATTALLVIGWFVALYPNVLPSSTDPAGTLDIYNAASSHYTLTVMTWVAVIMTPIVLLYQGWTYWVFSKRISTRHIPPAAPVAAPGAAPTGPLVGTSPTPTGSD